MSKTRRGAGSFGDGILRADILSTPVASFEGLKGPRTLTLLGSTGSIGTQTLEVVAQFPEHFKVRSLSAGNNIALLQEQVKAFRPVKVASIEPLPLVFRQEFPETEFVAGPDSAKLMMESDDSEIVVAGIVGFAGLESILPAVERGQTIALANKESIVCGGRLFLDAVRDSGSLILPVDSEHASAFQLMRSVGDVSVIERLVLTASGGAFRDLSAEELQSVSVEQALRHPTWNMGAKVTIDSASLMNKGLELIEAHWLFGLPNEALGAVIQPSSQVHALLELCDGSVLSSISEPDMRLPISQALSFPAVLPRPCERAKSFDFGSLAFAHIDAEKYPSIELARQVIEMGGAAGMVYNLANEFAVECFREKRIGFTEIFQIVDLALGEFGSLQADNFESLFDTAEYLKLEIPKKVSIQK